MDHNAPAFKPALQVAFQSALVHLETLENQPVAATASLSELRSRLAKSLNDHGLDPQEVVRDLVRDKQGGIVGSAGGRFFAWAVGGLADLGTGSECGLICIWPFGRGSGGGCRRLAERSAGNSGLGFVCFREWMPNGALTRERLGCRTERTLRCAAYPGFGFEPARLCGARDSPAGDRRSQRGRSRIGRQRADYASGAQRRSYGCAGCGHDCRSAGRRHQFGSFDDYRAVIPVAKRHGSWVHVDGAFGLWAGASPRYRHFLDGVEDADSWATDGHKWLNVPYD